LHTSRYANGALVAASRAARLADGVLIPQGGCPVEDEEAALPAEVLAAAEAVLEPHDEATEASVVAQMNSLYQRDLAMAIAFVVALLVVLPFLVIALWSVMPGATTKVVVIVFVVLLLVYNVTSMLYLVRNYRRDKNFIYRRDVAHLRELRAARRWEKSRVTSA
jgi:hypothetical protein